MQPNTYPTYYQIRIEGQLDDRWLRWFEGLVVTACPNGETEISGVMIDQAALHGILSRIRDLGLVLISVKRCTVPDDALN